MERLLWVVQACQITLTSFIPERVQANVVLKPKHSQTPSSSSAGNGLLVQEGVKRVNLIFKIEELLIAAVSLAPHIRKHLHMQMLKICSVTPESTRSYLVITASEQSFTTTRSQNM